MAKSQSTDASTDNSESQIARINELSKTASGIWFSLLGYLAFVGVTLLAVEDADFFIDSRQTQLPLPLVEIAIPTIGFFSFGGFILTLLFTTLHWKLAKTFDALGTAPSGFRGVPLATALPFWHLTQFFIFCRADRTTSARKHSQNYLLQFLQIFSVFLLAPATLFLMWWMSHDARYVSLSIGLAICFAIAIFVCVFSICHTFAVARAAAFSVRKTRDKLVTMVAFSLMVFGLSIISTLKTGTVSLNQAKIADAKQGTEIQKTIVENLTPQELDLSKQRFNSRPSGQVGEPVAKSMEQVCIERSKNPTLCRQTVALLPNESSPTINLENRNFSKVRLHKSIMIGTNLSKANFQGADLSQANISWSNLTEAKLIGALMIKTKAQSTKWNNAKLVAVAHGADLRVSYGLRQNMLSDVIGDKTTKLWSLEARFLNVWTCWPPERAPDNIDELASMAAQDTSDTPATLKRKWICSDKNPRRATGSWEPLSRTRP